MAFWVIIIELLCFFTLYTTFIKFEIDRTIKHALINSKSYPLQIEVWYE